MAELTIDAGYFIGLFVGLLLYGVYLSVFFTCVYQIRQRARDSKVVSSALWSLFFLSSGYYAIASVDTFRAFVTFRDSRGTLDYLNDFADGLASAKGMLYIISVPIADGLLYWRLWVIWPTNRIALVGVAILGTALIVSGFFVSIFEVRQAIVGDDRYFLRIQYWTVVCSALIIANNLIMTGCIAFRLWWMSKQVAFLGTNAQSLYYRIIFTLIQSGFLYLVIIVAQVVLYAGGVKSAIYLFLHISPAIVAMFPTAIVLQLNLQSRSQTAHVASKNPTRGLSDWAVAWPTGENSRGSDTTTGMMVESKDITLPVSVYKAGDVTLDLEMGKASDSSPSLVRGPSTIQFEMLEAKPA